MRVLFDTNILVDAAVRGRPYHQEAVALLNKVERGQISGVMAPLSLGTLWYLGTEHYSADPRPLLHSLRQLLDLAPMGPPVLDRALGYGKMTDFEDMYLAEAGRAAGAGHVVTRNAADFAPTDLHPLHPRELIEILS